MKISEFAEDDYPEGADPNAPAAQPEKVTGPLYGIPIDEVEAWIESMTTNNPLPTPKARRLR